MKVSPVDSRKPASSLSVLSEAEFDPGEKASPASSFGHRLFSLLGRFHNRHFLLLDPMLLMVLPTVALLLRLEHPHRVGPYAGALVLYTGVALVVRLGTFFACGLYHRCWRYAALSDLGSITAAVAISTVILCTLFFLPVTRSMGHGAFLLPRSVPLVDALLVLVGVAGVRFSMPFARSLAYGHPGRSAQRALIVGAGNAGQRIAADILHTPLLELNPIGFIDDNPDLKGMRIENLPVLGGGETLGGMIQDYKIGQVIIALPSASGKVVRGYLEMCKAAHVPAKIIPSIPAILEDRVSVSELRKVAIEDLLRRDPIHTDISQVRQLIRGRRVLITGAGGSIGSELCRQVLRCGPSDMALVGRGENSIFEIHNELLQLEQAREAQQAGNPSREATRFFPFIADVRWPRRIHKIVGEFQPDIIFHAAAHKHVPLMEKNPSEAIANNVIGTNNLLNAALEAGVEHFVMISTDKAVNPTSIMGASKRAAELYVLDAARQSGRPYVVVRFGNVLGSRGSVVPTFKRQIARGGPVTVSHPEMTRFFMTIPEAVQLLLQAAVLGKGGEVFMLDMGSPVKIVDLAADMIRLSGLEVDRDIDIIYTGMRPGEKLYEELFVPGELYEPTCHEKIFIAANASSRIPDGLPDALMNMECAVALGQRSAVVQCLAKLIPEFQPDEMRQGNGVMLDRAVVQGR